MSNTAFAELVDVPVPNITYFTTHGPDPLPVTDAGINIADALKWFRKRAGEVQKAGGSPASEAELSLKELKIQREIEKLDILNAKNRQSLVDPEAIQKQLRVACKNLKAVLEKVGEKYGCTDAIIEAISKVKVKVDELG